MLREFFDQYLGEVADTVSDQMYKRQLRRWNLRKNYSQEQKINIINELSQPRCSGHTRKSTKMLNGRPLKENRLLRSVLKNGKRASLPGQAEIRARRNKQKMSAISHQSRYLQRLQLQQSPEIQKTEDVLKHTQNYYSWYFEQTEVEKEYLYNGDLADAIIQLNLANHILLRQQQCTRAFALLNNCCSTFLGLLRTQPFQLSMQLVVEFTGPNALFRKHRGIWNALVHWFASASNFVLGPQHPITNIILLLTDVGQIESTSFSSRLTQVLDDTVEAVENCEDWNNLQLGLSWILVDFGDLDRASVLCQRLQDRVKPVCGSPTTGQRAVHHLMLRLSIRNKDFTHAEELGLQEVEWTKAATGMPNGNYEGIMACWRMASLYEAMDRCPESLQFHRLAFEGALQPPAECTTSDILDSYDDVARALSRLGRDEELAEFEAQYAYLWEEVMDEWELRPEPQALLDAGNRYLQQLG